MTASASVKACLCSYRSAARLSIGTSRRTTARQSRHRERAVAGGTHLCEHCLRGNRASGICDRRGYDGVPRNRRDFLPEGTELANRYLIGRTEGHGGFSVCYRAWDRRKSELIAIKELFPTP